MTFKLTIVILGVLFWVAMLVIKALDRRVRSKRAAAQAGRFAAAPVIAIPASEPYAESPSAAETAQDVVEAGGTSMSAAERAAQMRRDIGLMPSIDATQSSVHEPLVRSDLRRAVVMAEVLARPLALRRGAHAPMRKFL